MQFRLTLFTLLRQKVLWLATGMNGVLGFAGFRKDAPRLAAGCFTLVWVLACCLTPCAAANVGGPHYLSLGGRYHSDHSVFDDLPYGNGDISYALGYEYAEKAAIWQLALDFAPDVSGRRGPAVTNVANGASVTTNASVEYVFTPQMNLIFRDSYFRGGGGVLMSYIRDKQGEGEWLSPYFQFLLGLSFPLVKNMSLDAYAVYVFEKWDKLAEFAFEDLEYTLWLNFNF